MVVFLLAVCHACGREFPAERDFANLSLGTLKITGQNGGLFIKMDLIIYPKLPP